MGKKYIIDLNPDCVEGEYLRIPARIAGEEQWLVTKAALTPYTEPDIEQVRADAYNDGYKSGREAEKVRQPDLERVKADAYLKGLNDGQGVILESTQNNAFNNGYKKCLEDMEHDKGKENSIGYKIGYKKGYIDGLNRISDYEDKIRKEAYEQGLSDAWDAARTLWNTPNRKEVFGHTTFNTVLTTFTAQETIEKIRQYEQEKQFHVGDEFENENGKRFIILKMNGAEIDRYIDAEGKTYYMDVKYRVMHKTGRHFHEIAEVLQKMKES